jgi:predicted DNA-binding transcriptional regulator AlpA
MRKSTQSVEPTRQCAPTSTKCKLSQQDRSRDVVLPSSLAPRGLRRADAAAYIGVSPSKFDEMVADRRMPRAKRIDGRVVWDRLSLDLAFDDLPENSDVDKNRSRNRCDDIM